MNIISIMFFVNWSFFTDPTISTLTSGTPSQNVDLGGLSFPRRMGIRLHPDYIKHYHLLGLQCKWDSFEDAAFTKPMGKDFEHEDVLNREGWAMYYFKGKYPKDVAYCRLRIINFQTGALVKTFYFKFRKMYQMSLDSRYYVQDPVLNEKIVKNGVLEEVRPVKDGKSGKVSYVKSRTLFEQEKIKDVLHGGKREKVHTSAITQTMVRYSDKPKMVFLVTPPHLIYQISIINILYLDIGMNMRFVLISMIHDVLMICDVSFIESSVAKPSSRLWSMSEEISWDGGHALIRERRSGVTSGSAATRGW